MKQGDSQAFTITPGGCYAIADVKVDNVSQGSIGSYEFTNVQGDHAIAASFLLKTFVIAATAGAGGSISPAGDVSVGCGSSQSFTVTPDAGHHIADVLVGGGSVGAVGSYTFNDVLTNHTIAATFATTNFTINASAGSGGSITPSGAVTVVAGANHGFSITPDACYAVADVKVDNVSQGPVISYEFTNVQGDHTITASFTLNTYVISASAGTRWDDQPCGQRRRQLRRQPSLHDRAGHGLPRQ